MNQDIADLMEQQSSKTMEKTQKKAMSQLHQMNEKIASIDLHQDRTKRNRREIERLDAEIEQVLESINS